jgi:hypothetical protein
VLFFIAASASFNGYYDKWHFREHGVVLANSSLANGIYGFTDMVDGTATRPYVFRRLLPSIANWLDRVTPTGTKSLIYNFATNQGRIIDIMVDSPLAGNRVYFFRYLVVYALTFLFAWLAVFAMHLICRSLRFPRLTCAFAPVLMILVIPYFMTCGGYFYDYPELAFFGLAVWMGLRFDWWWMLPLVALASYNKESFLLMTLTLFPILRTRHSRIGSFIGTGCLALSSGAVYFLVRSHFSHNPGGTVLVEWPFQLIFLIRPSNLFDIEKTYGVLAFRPITLIPLALIVWTVCRSWPSLPQAIRRHGKIAAAINLPLFFLFCSPGEMRDLSMLYIIFLLALAANLAAIERGGQKLASA